MWIPPPRLAEKSVELNFAAQFRPGNRRVIWTGLTQAQEKARGFDAPAITTGRVFIFQFKVSDRVVRLGRKFQPRHDQLTNLVSEAGGRPESTQSLAVASAGLPRLSERHLFYLDPPMLQIRSEPFTVETQPLAEVIDGRSPGISIEEFIYRDTSERRPTDWDPRPWSESNPWNRERQALVAFVL